MATKCNNETCQDPKCQGNKQGKTGRNKLIHKKDGDGKLWCNDCNKRRANERKLKKKNIQNRPNLIVTAKKKGIWREAKTEEYSDIHEALRNAPEEEPEEPSAGLSPFCPPKDLLTQAKEGNEYTKRLMDFQIKQHILDSLKPAPSFRDYLKSISKGK